MRRRLRRAALHHADESEETTTNDTRRKTDPAPEAAPASAPRLPDARHLQRIPPGISPQDIARIQRFSYLLPQVLRPADLLDEHAPHPEQQLDERGLVQLQRAAGGRPSRWISPQDVAAALAHLDMVGMGPQARATMLARAARLDTLGIARRGMDFERLVRQEIALAPPAPPDWRLELASYRPAAREAVWAFHRTGDEVALEAAIGAVGPWPQEAALRGHLQSLVARAVSGHPDHLASLLPRLQAESARPQAWPELEVALTRAQDRWEHRAAELDALAGLTSELAFQGYPDSFSLARRMQRTVTVYVGPPNSGKTHAAFEVLARAHHGAYLAPLRLLALEGRDRLVARGVPCTLLTGEEYDPDPQARVISSTIEMVDTAAPIDVAVIDEAQMLFDESRGWAWTQAIVGVPADEVIIICSAHAAAAVEALVRLCGEACRVRTFERKQHVQLLPHPVPVGALRKGDAVVAFSRRDVLMLRDRIAADGHPVSVIYGALPPEVRRREAERYAHGHAHVLVATDAIGLGLNLPIRRVLFSTLQDRKSVV